MAHTIRVLPEQLANKIAAGEVVQRPASAVKELLENSIDAGARSITLVIAQGGKSSIRIIDDGGGMGPEDAVAAFGRHATSKISTVEDLEQIRTLGFRGEALAAIAAVAQVEMRTRRPEDEMATKIRIEGGSLIESVPDAAPSGTSITVKNLFFNTPGRRKFLKSDATEYKQIYDVVQRIALSLPSLALKFMSGHETILDLRPGDFAERLRAVFGVQLAGTVFPFEDSSEYVRLTGFLGRPDFARRTRAEQYLFLNGRFIVNRSLNHAVFKAYEHLLEKGSFPFFILYLSIDPGKVDVNVHPSKVEVKFSDEGSLYRIVHAAVRKSLSEHDLIPSAELGKRSSSGPGGGFSFSSGHSQAGSRSADWRELLRAPAPTLQITAGGEARSGERGSVREESVDFHVFSDRDPQAGLPADSLVAAGFVSAPVWQLHNKYLIVPVENGIMVVDQHAAHERVLYERVNARLSEPGGGVQQLLFPHTIELTPGDASLVGELLPLLEQIGFSVKMFGKTTAVLEGVPVDVKPGVEKTILGEILDLFKEDSNNVQLEPREKLAKSFSCRAAVKAGDPLNLAEMHSLLDQLFATKIPYVCPHGRPVMIRLSLAELDRRFGRTS